MLAELRPSIEEKVEVRVRKQVQTDYSRKHRQLESTVEALSRQRDELQRKVERLSAPERGDFNEDDLSKLLKGAFRNDRVEKRKRGQAGADIIQDVYYRAGSESVNAGRIVYECKDTARWSEAFVTQARAAQKTHRTPHVVLVTRALPGKQKSLVVRDAKDGVGGVVAVAPEQLIPLASILREMVIRIHRSGLGATGQTEKTEILYAYLSSDDFRGSFDSVVAATYALERLLHAEKGNHQRTWSRQQRSYEEIQDSVGEVGERISGIIEGRLRRTGRRAVRMAARTGRSLPPTK
jgi:hypothetical protein